LKVSKNPFLKL